MNKKIRWMSVLVAIALLLAAITPVFAQTGEDPVEDPLLEEGTKSFWDHPIVKLLAKYFSALFVPPVVEEPVEEEVFEPLPAEGSEGVENGGGEGTETEEPAAGAEGEEPAPVVVPEEVVAALHKDEKLGFGVITKLLQILSEAKVNCAENGQFCDVTLESLIEEYNAGASIGELFAKYGKPEMTGVGQVRKASDPKEKTNNGKKK